jgi:hypothetical protein
LSCLPAAIHLNVTVRDTTRLLHTTSYARRFSTGLLETGPPQMRVDDS